MLICKESTTDFPNDFPPEHRTPQGQVVALYLGDRMIALLVVIPGGAT